MCFGDVRFHRKILFYIFNICREDTLKAVKMSIILNPRRFQTEKILEVPFIDVFAVYHIFSIAKKYVL